MVAYVKYYCQAPKVACGFWIDFLRQLCLREVDYFTKAQMWVIAGG